MVSSIGRNFLIILKDKNLYNPINETTAFNFVLLIVALPLEQSKKFAAHPNSLLLAKAKGRQKLMKNYEVLRYFLLSILSNIQEKSINYSYL
ncbi:hypothetical protein CXB77_07145 [Chromatium okenii]|uniref:Uncharacterized protein n=1 Tax=Chromatium okenii TaxID=61644 RepID=A0A2S7XS92_9GAMM|nr:hypothetical protein CXB77_07145 [Chromatium okenii]